MRAEPSDHCFADLALARRFEAADAVLQSAYVRAHARLRPAEGACEEWIAGGHAAYAGAESPLTQAVNFGMQGVVTETEVDQLEGFFAVRGAAVNLEQCPLADASLLMLLNGRGYRIAEQTTKLFRPLRPADTELAFDPTSPVQVRVAAPEDADEWVRVVCAGFTDSGSDVPPLIADVGRASFMKEGARCWLAEIDGRAVGGGLVYCHAGVASLATTATHPDWRGRGAQTALLRARLADGAAQGCDLAAVSTQPGSTSQRNVERQGFRVAYTRCKFEQAVGGR